MKSLSDRPASALALLLALGCTSATAPGGVSAPAASGAVSDTTEPSSQRQRPPGDREFPTSRESSERNRSDSVIKCWQFGRLILDEDNWKTTDPGIAGPVLHADSGRFSKLKLMQFGDHTFCTLKHGAR